jgi:hypothetical protein
MRYSPFANLFGKNERGQARRLHAHFLLTAAIFDSQKETDGAKSVL